MINLDISGVLPFLYRSELMHFGEKAAARAAELLESGTGEGAGYLGWLDLSKEYDRDEFARIQAAAEKIKSDSKAVVVIGIGGSYLGARAAIEMLHSPEYNLMRKDTPNIFFAGNNLSGAQMERIIGLIGDEDFSVIVISKSGTTTEPAVAFRIFRELLEKKYGEAARERIYAVTDRERGALLNLAKEKGYERFVVPDDIGGRYSVLTAVGLLPIAVAGIDISAIMEGAEAERVALSADGMSNPAWQYAAARQLLYRKGKKIELFAGWDPAFHCFGEWWKQLFGESEGKNHIGLFPASADFTTDLHSLGQYIQQGERMIIETLFSCRNGRSSLCVPSDESDADGLNYIAGKTLHYVNDAALRATKQAHVDGGVPCFEVTMDRVDEREFGALVYFFEFACGISGYISGVNPFDQPGVEAYKSNMFHILGKPGY